MANQQPPAPNSAGFQCYPGTDMTGMEMDLLRELMRKAERNNMMAATMTIHQAEQVHHKGNKGKQQTAQQGGKNSANVNSGAPQGVYQWPADAGRGPKSSYIPEDDPWAEKAPEYTQGSVPKANPPVLQIFGNVSQGTPPVNLPPAATAMGHSGSAGFPEFSAAALGTESKFPPANAKSSPGPPPNQERQLPIPKPTGQNKAAKTSPEPTIQEVINEAEEKTGISIGWRMDDGSKRLREDDEDVFGFEYIPEDVSPPWFPNNLWGIPATVQHHHSDWGDKNWYPDYATDDMDPTVPIPVHVQGIREWATTKLKMKKFEDKGWSYHDLLLQVFNHDAEAGHYAKWVLSHYTSKITSTPKTQAPDLAAFLKKMRVDSFLGATNTYRRELMKVDFAKKP